MDIIEFLKSGNKIHIKKENKGKFTSYCGGKVTQECIAKGKRSSNATIRKRATFAANARKWKHLNGGIMLSLGETGLNLLLTGILNNKLKNQLNSIKALNLIEFNLIMNLIIELNKQQQNQNYLLWISDYQNGTTLDQPSLIVASHLNSLLLNQLIADEKLKLKNKNSLITSNVNSLITSNLANSIGGLFLTGLDYYINSKQNSPTQNDTQNNNLFKLDNFWTNPSLKQ